MDNALAARGYTKKYPVASAILSAILARVCIASGEDEGRSWSQRRRVTTPMREGKNAWNEGQTKVKLVGKAQSVSYL